MSRKKKYVISCQWPNGETLYLAGHCAAREDVTCLFTANVEEAISSEAISVSKSCLDMGWPFLLRSHAEKTGKPFKAVIHAVSEDPVFSCLTMPDLKKN